MNRVDVLFITGMFISVVLLGSGCIATLSRQFGVAEGKLEVLEEFKHLYMPNPANVYPDAVDTLEVGR